MRVRGNGMIWSPLVQATPLDGRKGKMVEFRSAEDFNLVAERFGCSSCGPLNSRAMPRYAAFLRGVMPMNAKMPDLKRAFERAGFTDVKTILGSGNVVF